MLGYLLTDSSKYIFLVVKAGASIANPSNDRKRQHTTPIQSGGVSRRRMDPPLQEVRSTLPPSQAAITQSDMDTGSVLHSTPHRPKTVSRIQAFTSTAEKGKSTGIRKTQRPPLTNSQVRASATAPSKKRADTPCRPGRIPLVHVSQKKFEDNPMVSRSESSTRVLSATASTSEIQELAPKFEDLFEVYG
jgi:hypothetical protein